MSAKYSEKNVLKIKQDIQRSSEELATINADIDFAKEDLSEIKREIERTKSVLEDERKKVGTIWDKIAKNLQISQATNARLTSENISLERQNNLVRSQVQVFSALLHETINRLSEVKDSSSGFLGELIKASKLMLESLYGQKKKEEQAVASLKNEHSRLESMVLLLEENRKAYEEKISSLQKALDSKQSELERVTVEKAKAESLIETIKRRDHDSRVMEMRLTEDYQKVYFKNKNELRNRKI